MDCMQLNTMTKAIVIDAIVYASSIRACTVARRLVAVGRKVPERSDQ